MTRAWTVEAVTPDAKERWMPIVEACPWDDVPNAGTAGAGSTGSAAADRQPGSARPPVPADRFVYSIRAGRRRATLPEQAVTGPWRVLVDCARSEGESSSAARR